VDSNYLRIDQSGPFDTHLLYFSMAVGLGSYARQIGQGACGELAFAQLDFIHQAAIADRLAQAGKQ
jgi:hypothetical protein